MKEFIITIGIVIALVYIAFNSFALLYFVGFNAMRNILAMIGLFFILRPLVRNICKLFNGGWHKY
ncbi:hypothetical protein AWJ19_33760 [Paenibacillus sp. DMB5]|nr:hypothetical protein AWJ19_33760 [Paenibacillus sp. DMB5]